MKVTREPGSVREVWLKLSSSHLGLEKQREMHLGTSGLVQEIGVENFL